MEDLTYFYETDTAGEVLKDDEGNPIKRKHKLLFEVDLLKAIDAEASHEKILEICHAIIDTKQWQWLALYEQWLNLRDTINAQADAIPQKLDGAGNPIPGEWLGEYTPNGLRATIPDQPERPELVSFEEVYGPYQRAMFIKERAALVDQIAVEVDGLVFDGYETAQDRMCRAVTSMEPGEQMMWTLHDNSTAMVSREILLRALRAAGMKQGSLWHRV